MEVAIQGPRQGRADSPVRVSAKPRPVEALTAAGFSEAPVTTFLCQLGRMAGRGTNVPAARGPDRQSLRVDGPVWVALHSHSSRDGGIRVIPGRERVHPWQGTRPITEARVRRSDKGSVRGLRARWFPFHSGSTFPPSRRARVSRLKTGLASVHSRNTMPGRTPAAKDRTVGPQAGRRRMFWRLWNGGRR